MNIENNNNTQPTSFNNIDIPKEHWNNESVQKWCKVIGIPEDDIIIIRNYKLDGFWLIFKHTSGNLEKELKDLGVSLPSSARILAKFIPPTQGQQGKWDRPQDLLEWMINRYGAPKPPVDDTTSEMPLMGRDMVLQDIYNKVLTRYQTPNRKKDNQHLLVVAGAPGIGKTRILQEIGKYFRGKIESKLPKHQIDINISLGNGSPWAHREASNPEFALCKRILHKYFADGHNVSYATFANEILSMLKSIDEKELYDFCFNAIHYHLTSLDPTMQNQELLINFGIDEFQKCLIESEDKPQRRSILKTVIQSISGLLVERPNSKFFVNIVFAGTILEDIKLVIGESSIPYHFIPLRLLNLNEYMGISKQILGIQKSNNIDIQRAIRFMGGWPRPLEVLFQVILNSFDSDAISILYNTSDLLGRVEADLNGRYPITSEDKDLSPTIIAYSVTQEVIDPLHKPLANSPSFGSLQSHGRITITSDNKVFLPLIFLRRYTNLNATSPLLNTLQKLISFLEKKSSWEEWEIFNCYLEIIKHQSHHYISKKLNKSCSLGGHYRSALFFPPILANSTFSKEVDTLSICSFPTNRCPEKCDIDEQCQAGTAIIKNANGAFVDMFYNAKLDIGTTYFLGNAKHTDNSTATLKSIDLDLANYVKASKLIVEQTINEQQIKFIPVVYSNHFVTPTMKTNFENNLRNLTQIKSEPKKIPIKITEAIIVCRGTKDNNNEIQHHDGFYYPFQDFIYPR
ncbi:hypothetical protein DLAC_11409 [Tieghemostelium lacteum]|uniref:Uncharacterized protein n=1 Tax=Tieghemostelium lacteum TaxID=361077 RepID=A0A151Z2J7_TIELA|nr:hypothetical protein DLAC_11409 [Tieghemostelium lacteum]|eukprot:KYQ88158.1 hypothetical protein DLAC_11409 [Tieghemostelium lacteum]